MKKKQRARILEFFIDVARECFNIGNFNSLMAIISKRLIMSEQLYACPHFHLACALVVGNRTYTPPCGGTPCDTVGHVSLVLHLHGFI